MIDAIFSAKICPAGYSEHITQMKNAAIYCVRDKPPTIPYERSLWQMHTTVYGERQTTYIIAPRGVCLTQKNFRAMAKWEQTLINVLLFTDSLKDFDFVVITDVAYPTYAINYTPPSGRFRNLAALICGYTKCEILLARNYQVI